MNKQLQSEKGMALVVALLFVFLAIFALDVLALRLVNQKNQVDKMVTHKTVFNGLESAFSMSKAELESESPVLLERDGSVGVQGFTQPETGFVLPSFEDEAVTPLTLTKHPYEEHNVEFFAYSQDWSSDGIDNNGDGDIDDETESDTYTVWAMAKKGDISRQATVVMAGENVNVWNNAIFANAGQGGNLINGNVSISGSVHLLGNHPDDDLVQVLDLSGTSLISNSYDGIPSELDNRIPELDTISLNGEDVETLGTKLRIKQGKVTLWGNSHVGHPDLAGNDHKETIKGIYADAQWSIVDPGNINSDNGMSEGYDLSDKVPFPTLSDDWRWSEGNDWGRLPGTFEPRPDNPAINYTHEEFFTQVLVADPDIPTDGIYNGSIDLYTKGTNFYWNASTGVELIDTPVSDADIAASLANGEDFMYFDATDDHLWINGQIAINGTLKFTPKGGDDTINYSGRAAILTTGEVQIDTNLVTCNNGDAGNIANSFPVNNILGIMSKSDMVVGGTSQIDIMGAFYSEQTMHSAKQTNVAGTFVANYFNMGTNVPAIFQVPELADNLPFGMVGDYPILVMSFVYWQEAGIENLLVGN